MAVEWSAEGNQFRAGVPRRWSAMPVADFGISPNIDAGPKGHIAALMPSPATANARQDEHHVTFVLNLLPTIRTSF